MTARIRSLRNGDPGTQIDDASRNDLVSGDTVKVSALDAAATYNWAIVFAPQSPAGVPSTATFTLDVSLVSPGTFTVDNEGAYLIRLIVDAGLASESTQYVRLRALTASLGLQLVAAGERRDTSGIIPVDVSVEGWSNEQNFNLQALEAAVLSAQRKQVFSLPLPGYVKDLPATASSTYYGWVSEACVLQSVKVFLKTLTAGTCTLGVRNMATGNLVLLGGGLYAVESTTLDTVVALPLKASGDPDLVFDPAVSGGRWDLELVSDATWDGTDVHIELIFGVS
jgi:hypothetical protein